MIAFRFFLVIGFLFFVTGCTTTSPPPPSLPDDPAPPVSTPEPDDVPPPRAPIPEQTSPLPEMEPEERADDDAIAAADSAFLLDPLYEQTEDALRLAFTDGLFGLYRAEVNPADAQRLSREEVESWLTDLELVSPRAVASAREMLGPVLAEPYVVGLLLEDAAQTDCASVRDVLYIPIPARFQGPDRAFNGYIVQDTCDLSPGDLAPFCFGGFGTSASGATCSCTCTTGEPPAQPCVRC